MAASTVTRSTWTDDSGDGISGSIVNNAELQKIYAAIDQMLSGTGLYATLSFGGVARIEGKGLQVKGTAAPAVAAASEGNIYYDSTLQEFLASQNGGAYSALLGSKPIHQAAGSSTAAGATNVDTFTLPSTLTVKDKLRIIVSILQVNANGSTQPLLYNVTDSVSLGNLQITGANFYINVVDVGVAPNSTVKVASLIQYDGAGPVLGRSTFTTPWTSSPTLALRHNGVTAGDTWNWEWAIYLVPGQ